MAQMALAWLLRLEVVTSVLIGASSVEQLHSNVDCLKNVHFNDDELKKIDQILTD